MNTKMVFQIVPESDWQLGDRIGSDRKVRLLEVPYDRIMAQIVSDFALEKIQVQPHPRIAGLCRALVNIAMPTPHVVDDFHNGAGGYRAQYYFGVAEGDRANLCVLTEILSALEEQRALHSDLNRHWRFIKASLSDAHAKIWIHEGAWLSDNRADCRNLFVVRWRQNAGKITIKHRFEPSWAELTPENETMLNIKGGYLSHALEAVPIANKFGRAQEIHDFGYT